MSDLATIDYANSAFEDIERLEEFLALQESTLKGLLAAFIAKAITILAIQRGIGRPVSERFRELVIRRNRSD